jgi:hypothetical protein
MNLFLLKGNAGQLHCIPHAHFTEHFSAMFLCGPRTDAEPRRYLFTGKSEDEQIADVSLSFRQRLSLHVLVSFNS